MLYTVPTDPAERFTLTIEGLLKALACCGGVRPIGINGLPVKPIAGPLLALIWNRLRYLQACFLRALATLPAPYRHRASRAGQPRPIKPGPVIPPHYVLPRHFAWLLRLSQESNSYGSQLRHLISDPEVSTRIEADPRLGRALRPLCHMLGIKPAWVPVLYPQPQPPVPSQPPAQPPDAAPAAPPPPPPPEGGAAQAFPCAASGTAAKPKPPPPDVFSQTLA